MNIISTLKEVLQVNRYSQVELKEQSSIDPNQAIHPNVPNSNKNRKTKSKRKEIPRPTQAQDKLLIYSVLKPENKSKKAEPNSHLFIHFRAQKPRHTYLPMDHRAHRNTTECRSRHLHRARSGPEDRSKRKFRLTGPSNCDRDDRHVRRVTDWGPDPAIMGRLETG